MVNWIVAQQVVLSLTLLLLICTEKLALKHIGACQLYTLWWLLPAALIINNLPQEMMQFGTTVIYQYLVKFDSQAQDIGTQLSWNVLWLTGCIAIIVYTLYSQWQISTVAHSPFATSTLPLDLPSSLKVVSADHFKSPVLLGILKPTLVLPREFQVQFSPLQQSLILQHELVHYRRADNLFNLLAILLVAVFWFNPLVWLAYSAFRRSQELACDNKVLRNQNTSDKIAYSKALLLCLSHPKQTFSLYSQYGAKHTMLNRITAIKHNPPSKTRSLLLTVVLSASLLSTITLANQQQKPASTSQVNEASPIVRIEPKYPVQAAQANIEGSVLLQFDITEDGSTANIKVLKAEPVQTFDKEAVRALTQWRYKPQVIGGKAQVQTNLLVQLDFRMDENPREIRSLVEGIKVLSK
tara:strand:- start:36 stop:1265 length:1230 start_codon:yes stop_codon:yes gene_type:complete